MALELLDFAARPMYDRLGLAWACLGLLAAWVLQPGVGCDTVCFLLERKATACKEQVLSISAAKGEGGARETENGGRAIPTEERVVEDKAQMA